MMAVGGFGRRSLTVFSGQWAGYAMQLVSGVLAARLLGPDAVGLVGFSFGVIGLFMVVTALGFSHAHMKRVTEGMDIGLALGTYGALTAGLNALAAGGALLMMPFFSGVLSSSEAKFVFVMLLLYQTASNLSQVFVQTLWGREEFVKGTLAMFSGRAVRFLAICSLLPFFRSVTALTVCYLMEACVLLVSGFVLLPSGVRIRRPSLASLSSYWRFTRHWSLSSISGMLGESIDRVIMGAGLSLASLGQYSVARSILEAMKSLPAGVGTALFPELTRETSERGYGGLALRFSSIQRRFFVSVTPMAVLGAFWSPRIVSFLYGEAFRPASVVLSIFFGVFWAICLFNPATYVILASERHAIMSVAAPTAQAIYLACVWWSVKTLGGAALPAAAGALVIPYVVTFAFVLFRVPFRIAPVYSPWIFRAFAGAAVMSTVIGAGALKDWGVFPMMVLSAGGFAAYVGCLSVLGEPVVDDWRRMMALANPSELFSFLRDGLKRTI